MSTHPTLQDEERLIQKLERPSSAVTCWVNTRLVLPSQRPRAVVRRLDVDGAALLVEHAIPNHAIVTLPLPLPRLGDIAVPARLVRALQPHPQSFWVAELKFQIPSVELRNGVAQLVRALHHKHRSRADGPLDR